MSYIYQKNKFFEVLKDIFIGAKIEGKSGYVNLMKIKSKYFEDFKHKLESDISKELDNFDVNFAEELYNKLYTFFNKYFSESGSIYFSYTPIQEKVYEKIYRDDKDVMLFWKTNMLYYVKSERLFKDLEIEDTETALKFYFDVSQLELKKNNEKKELVFELKELLNVTRDTRFIAFWVKYSKSGSKTKSDDILKALHKHSQYKHITINNIERIFAIFKKQSEVDYFINKNAKEFLREQFLFWIKSYLIDDETIYDEKRLKQMKALKSAAFKIIDLVSQFEDELVKIWNKPKFAHSSNYVITIDKIAELNSNLLNNILQHSNIEEQVEEWKQLGIADNDFDINNIFDNTLEGKSLSKKWKFLPLDTKYFKDLELDILALFDNLDEQLDGWLIHSENYQALNTIKGKFKGKVQTIYVDPPYNTTASEITYVNGYKESSFLTFLENRYSISKQFLTNHNGVFISAIDDTEFSNLIHILRQIYINHDINVVVINHHPAGAGLETANISTTHEYSIFLTPKGLKILKGDEKEGVELISFIRTGTADSNLRVGRPNSFYAIIIDPNTKKIIGLEPPPNSDTYNEDETSEGYLRIYPKSSNGIERVWRRSYESCKLEIEKGNIICSENNTIYLRTDSTGKYKPIHSNWIDKKYNAGAYGTNLLKNLMGTPSFSYPKSLYTVLDAIKISSQPTSIVLDFFGGSGTTAHSVIEMNKLEDSKRKYILCEMGDHFQTVIIPRLKKVVFSDNWLNGEAKEGLGITQFFKYYSLEQYEETLSRVKYEDKAPVPNQNIYHQYIFLKDLKLTEEVLNIDEQTESIKVDLTKLHKDIDIPETLSHLLGKFIKQIKKDELIFTDGTIIDLQNIDYRIIKPLIWW